MKVIRRPRLNLEFLEERECPVARVTYTGAALIITGPVTPNSPGLTGGLQLTLTANNQVVVTDNHVPLGKYNASNVYINALRHQNSPITVDLGGFTLGGNVLVNEGSGDTSGDERNSVGIFNGKLGGTFTDLGGSGENSVVAGFDPRTLPPGNVTPSTLPANPLTIGGDVLIAGRISNNVPVSGGELFDTGIGYAPATSPVVTIGGSVTTSAVNAVTLAANTTIGKDLTVSNPLETLNGASGLFFAGKLQGNLNYTGQQNNVGGEAVILSTGASVGGNLNATLGLSVPGGNSVTLAPGTTINGSVNASVASGSVSFSGIINGNATARIGDAGGTFAFDNGGGAVQAVVAGNLNVFGGNGVIGNVGPLTGNVNGNVNVTLGNGNNPNWTFGDGTAGDGVIGGKLTWRSGNGTDSLTIGSPNNYLLDVLFGNNDDTFSGSAGATLTGSVNGGGRLAGNVFNQNGATLGSSFRLSNFP